LRHGFTLIEVVVAAAILIILLIGLSGVFARGVTGFKGAQLTTMAQNLAEFQIEDLKNLAPSKLDELVRGVFTENPDPNYPNATADATTWLYDSGKVQTDFVVDGIDSLTGTLADGTAVAFTVPPTCAGTLPTLPTEDQLLLGNHVVVELYADDPVDTTLRYWYDFDAGTWYYVVTVTGQRVDTVLADPAGTYPYWRVTLQKEAYPLFSRQVRVAEYDAAAPAGFDPWADTGYRSPATDADRKFAYEMTVWYTHGGGDEVLFRTAGTVGDPLFVPATP
jgi:type II secretory pathway pseudopilin PulG